MSHALTLLAGLDDGDLDWLFAEGQEQRVLASQALTVADAHPDALYIVLEGLFEVRLASFEGGPVARLGPSELVGEMSLLTDEPASASVIAAEDSLVLALPRKVVDERVEADPRFAARLYRSFALLAARRLRERVSELGARRAERALEPGTLAEVIWGELSEALGELKASFAAADAEGLHSGDRISAPTVERTSEQFSAFVDRLNRAVGDASPLPPAVAAELGQRVQRELLPYILLGENAERFYSKPRGYAGDFLTMHKVYENHALGVGRLGPPVDRCFLDLATCVAARNRAGLLAEENQRELVSHPDRPVRMTSLACGPGDEVFQVYAGLADPKRLEAPLVDIDFQALAFLGDRRDRLGLRKQLRLLQSNLIFLATGRENLEIPPQDLVYSVGLIDYFEDRFVVLLLDRIHQLLVPGGRVILGNFHPRNPVKALMDHVLDWKLVHRSEQDMDRLFAASAFGGPCTRIRFEAAQINLFAEGVKAGG